MKLSMACLAALAFLVSLAGAAPAPVKKTNLLVNGSFEEGPPIGNYLGLNPGDTSVKGWVVTRAQIDIVGNYWPAAHGQRSIDLHGSPGLGGIQQTFATKPGRTYLVTFSLAANPDGTVPKKLLGVSAAGKSAEFSFDGTGKTLKQMGWAKKSWRFTAIDKQTTLEFYTLMKNDEACGPVLDDVCVVEAN
jgi:choice-of-anchor C domain-containing protein